jgi:hypothetical protein
MLSLTKNNTGVQIREPTPETLSSEFQLILKPSGWDEND